MKPDTKSTLVPSECGYGGGGSESEAIPFHVHSLEKETDEPSRTY
jgi:hypothetical protein